MRRRVTQNGGAEIAPPPPQPLQARIAALAEPADRRAAAGLVRGLGCAAAEGRAAAAPDARHRLDVAGRGRGRLLQAARAAARDARGGLPAGRRTEAERARTFPTAGLLPGARLIRIWKAERHEVLVAESGYLWGGRSWGSLSSIAREITGTRRNGPAFFGLRDREAP